MGAGQGGKKKNGIHDNNHNNQSVIDGTAGTVELWQSFF